MKRKVLILIVGILFIIDAVFMQFGITKEIDNNISLYFSLNNNNLLTSFFKFISFICSPKFMIIINAVLFIYIMLNKKYRLLIITLSSILSVIVNNLVKIIVRRERPNFLRLVVESSYSFPSGHAMISVLFFGSIIYLINKSNIKYRKTITLLLIIFIALVCISRIYLGVHYLTDVVGGVLMAIFIELILIDILERKKFI